MLHHCDEHISKKDDSEDDKEKTDGEDKTDEEAEKPKSTDDTFQSFAVIAIALIAMGETVGAEMCLRQFNHLVCHFLPPALFPY